jgi:hypothetical protein
MTWQHSAALALFANLGFPLLVFISSRKFSGSSLQKYIMDWRLICAEGSTIPPYILKLKIEDDENQFLDEILLRLPLLSNVKRLMLIADQYGKFDTGCENEDNHYVKKSHGLTSF